LDEQASASSLGEDKPLQNLQTPILGNENEAIVMIMDTDDLNESENENPVTMTNGIESVVAAGVVPARGGVGGTGGVSGAAVHGRNGEGSGTLSLHPTQMPQIDGVKFQGSNATATMPILPLVPVPKEPRLEIGIGKHRPPSPHPPCLPCLISISLISISLALQSHSVQAELMDQRVARRSELFPPVPLRSCEFSINSKFDW
jgi:hypothetical protein